LLLLELRVTRANLLFARGLGDSQAVEVMLLLVRDDLFAKDQPMLTRLERHRLASRKDFVPAMLLAGDGALVPSLVSAGLEEQ
jgi:hypothetical protein